MNKGDLDAAVAAGILDQAKASELEKFLGERSQTPGQSRDEPFQFLKNFNEVFLTIGVGLLLFGVAALVGTLSVDDRKATSVLASAGTLITSFILAEILTLRLKTVAPSILLAATAAISAFVLAQSFLEFMYKDVFDSTNSALIAWSVTFACSLAFYLRYSLPFSLASLAVSAMALIMLVTLPLVGSAAGSLVYLVPFLLGVAVFATALMYDFSDPLRRTRAHQNAFWLHLVSAPMIVHGLFGALATQPSPQTFGAYSLFNLFGTDIPSFPVVASVFLVLTMISLIVDRRAILVSSLTYLGAALATTFKGFGSSAALSFTPIVLGILVLTLGVGWQQIRSAVLSALPTSILKSRVPQW